MNKHFAAVGKQDSHSMKGKLPMWNERGKGRKNGDVGPELEVSVGMNYLKFCVCWCG